MAWRAGCRPLFVAAVLSGFAVPSAAQTMAVAADVVLGCALLTSQATSGIDFGSLAFGTHPAVKSGAVTAAVVASGGGAMQVECTRGMTVQVTVGAGQHASGAQRRLALNGNTSYVVPYTLYTTAAHTTPLPVNTSVSVTVPSDGLLTLPIYGSATLPGSGLMPGAYGDTVVVTLSW